MDVTRNSSVSKLFVSEIALLGRQSPDQGATARFGRSRHANDDLTYSIDAIGSSGCNRETDDGVGSILSLFTCCILTFT